MVSIHVSHQGNKCLVIENNSFKLLSIHNDLITLKVDPCELLVLKKLSLDSSKDFRVIDIHHQENGIFVDIKVMALENI